jgi:hypothetical protein
MLGLDAVNSYFLVVAMAALLVMVLVWQPHRSRRTVVVWLASGAVGVVLGSAVSYAAMRLAGYDLAKAPPAPPAANAAASTPSMGGDACPMAKGYLMNLVRKLDLLTGDIGITLTAEQAADVANCLKGVETPAKMSNSDAKAKYHRLANVLSADQKARLAAIGLPQPGSDGPAMGLGMMMGGGALPDAEAKAFRSLRERLASKGTAPTPETPKAPPGKTETPKAQPPKADASKSPATKS